MGNRILLAGAFLLAACFINACSTFSYSPYHDTTSSPESRARDLVARLTADEKISQCMMDSPAIPRLGIPAYHWWSEALHGIAREGTATVFPQAIGLAATFDPDLLHTIAGVISTEARAKHEEALRHGDHSIYKGLTLWSPNINIFRDPRWGRGQETYGEDPFLTSRMGVAFVTGIQGDDPDYLRCVATPKHFAVHSGPEPARHHFDALVSDRDLHETYLPAFQACVMEGHAASVMAAYSSFNGVPATGNPALLTDTLRTQWGFNGAVVSDVDSVRDIWLNHFFTVDAAEASAVALHAGDDLCSGTTYKALRAALDRNLITEADLDKACVRLFTVRFRLGMFDSQCPYNKIPMSENDSPAHDALALEAAHKSIVMLKNDGVLPLNRTTLKRVAVIGPVADDLNTLVGNYYGTPSHPVTILKGIRDKLAPYGIAVDAAPGCPLVQGFRDALQPIPPGLLFTDATQKTPGLRGDYYKGETLEVDGTRLFSRTDPAIDLEWSDAEPLPRIPVMHVSIRWTGVFVAPSTGTFTFGSLADDGVRVWIDNHLVIDDWNSHNAKYFSASVPMEAGHAYNVRVEYFQARGGAVIRLGWKPPVAQSMLDDALALAKNADAVVLTLGITPELEGEEMQVDAEGFMGGDRVSIDLPKSQQELLNAISALGKPVVLVLTCGSCLNFDTTKANAAIVQWYSGQRGGAAVADVLLGDCNPSGRLPVTFYKSVADLPNFSDYSMVGRTYRYFGGSPLYPFGHGLSYLTFDYGQPVVADVADGKPILAGDVIHVALPVIPRGKLAGDEVVQVYARILDSSVNQPIHALVAFQRVSFNSGTSGVGGRIVTIDIPTERLRYWDTKTNGYVIPTGEVELQIGASSADIRQTVRVTIAPK